MSDESIDLPEKPSKGWLIWLLIGLAPIPIGLLIGPLKIFDSFQSGHRLFAVTYIVIAAVCGMLCGIGQADGFKTKKISRVLTGCLAGILIGIFDFGIVFFAGCCCAVGHM
jgi:hypothetical protein